jgi:DNA-directed RNA polymerase specialized sigma subunit
VTDHRTELPDLFEEMIAASDEVCEAIASHNASRRVAIERLRRGDDLRSIVDDSPLAANLERTRAAMAELDTARGRIRSAVMRALLDEGMTKREIAQRWGVSPQLVSRYTADGPRKLRQRTR